MIIRWRFSPLRRIPVILCMLCICIAGSAHTTHAKLVSSSMEEQRCKNIIDDILRRTRLNDDERIWGDRYKDEIARFVKMLGTSYYQIFGDLNIAKAMARCVVNARNESDYQRWLQQMDEFDRAVKDLDKKDRGRYHFAKGLLILQSIPKVQSLPVDFYKAAENGYSSTFLAEYITPESTDQAKRTNGYNLSDALQKLAESYRKGNELKEAYKFYLLAGKYGSLKSDYFLRMVECAHLGGNDTLALASGLMFLEAFPLAGGGEKGAPGILERLPVSAGMSADDIWRYCSATPLSPFQSSAAPSSAVEERTLGNYDSRYIQPITKNLGAAGDFFEAVLCARYWNDSLAVLRFLPRINGPITAFYVDTMATRLRDDPRFSTNADCSTWEARRWKEAGKLDEFAAQYPLRYEMSDLAPKKEPGK